MTEAVVHRPPVLEAAARTSARRASRPVVLWAAAGAAFVLLFVYVFFAWIAFDSPARTPVGRDAVPDYMLWSARILEVAGLFALGTFCYFFLVRPWRREGHITLDGCFVLAFIPLYWIDPITNFTQPWVTYNAAFVNFGVWAERIPGWTSPNGRLLAEPAIFAMPTYLYGMFGGAVLANVFMRRARARWPRLSNFQLVLGTYVAFILFDFAVEIPFMFLGGWSFPGAIHGLTIFAGHYYQYPIYEGVMLGGCWTAYACLRFFRDDQGRTIAERGIDEVNASPRAKSVIRVLAIVGAVNVLSLVCYGIPVQWFGMHADRWPADYNHRSYLRNGICGPDTEYSCPGNDVPVPRGRSAHLDPHGNLVPAVGSGDR